VGNPELEGMPRTATLEIRDEADIMRGMTPGELPTQLRFTA
jgi:hypothetical protein